jgi:hypothetical protein
LETLFHWVVHWLLLQIVSMNSLSLFASSSHHLIFRIVLQRWDNSWQSELHTGLWPTLPWLLL